jgi:protoheme IX farnesyltransferase
VYTFLKRKTGFAVIPGSLTGALPPLIGWVAAGGGVTEPLIIYISVFVFIWQIPHFWLRILIYGKEYQEAGLPTLFEHFTKRQIRIGTFMSIVFSISYASVFIAIFSFNLFLLSSLPLAILLLILVIYNLFYKYEIRNLKTIFHSVNFFMLLFLLTLLIIAKKNL